MRTTATTLDYAFTFQHVTDHFFPVHPVLFFLPASSSSNNSSGGGSGGGGDVAVAAAAAAAAIALSLSARGRALYTGAVSSYHSSEVQ